MIIKKNKDEIISYLEDSSNVKGGKAETLYVPENEKEVLEAVKECASKRVPLTISAGGTGTVGGRVPFGGRILSVEGLNKIICVDEKRKRAILQSGVIISDFLKILEPKNLFYPPFPTERTAFIGGNVATNASGEYSFRFGCTRKYIRRIKVILSTGELIEIERGKYFASKDGYLRIAEKKIKIPSYISPPIKNSAGYFSHPEMDLIDLFIGSEGTLGVITEVEVELIPAFSSPFIMIIFLKEEKILNLLGEIKESKKISPLCLEYFDKHSLEFLKEDFPDIPEGAREALYIEEEESEDILEEWVNLMESYPVIDTWISQDRATYERLINFRHKLAENINNYFRKIKLTKVALDIAVPENSFRELFNFYKNIRLNNPRIETVLFGHIGENHLHFNFFPRDEKEREKVIKIYQEAIKKGVKLGGTISAEHGVGKIKHKYLEMMYGKKGVMEMVRVKKEIDPFCIFGLDNIFSKSLLRS